MRAIDDFRGEYRWLSNFQNVDIEYKGIWYPTTEHAYQASKSPYPEVRRVMSYLSSPAEAKRIGRIVEMRMDWESIKYGVMLDLTRLKFEHKWLREKLLATGNVELIEGNTWDDTYWGVCGRVGLNNLGNILMQVREEIKNGK